MGQKTSQNFSKRFGDRIAVSYQEKPMEPAEMQIHNQGLLTAFNHLVKSVLGRAPTAEEMLGLTEIRIPEDKSHKA